jgi:2-phosphosulfolactate phosphatase
VEIHVAFLPEEIGDPRRRAVVVIDVLRATTSLLVLLERGCAEAVIAPSLESARQYRSAHPAVLAAGEQGGRAPAGFDFGNSPVAFARSDVAGRRVVLATTNGTRALYAARAAAVTLIGCLRNRSAAARAVLAAARREELDITLACAGREGRFGLDDAYTAGAILDAMLADPAGAGDLDPTDAAHAARALYRAFPEAEALFRTTRAGRNLVAIGLAEDLPYCAEQDRSAVAPRVGERVRLLDT